VVHGDPPRPIVNDYAGCGSVGYGVGDTGELDEVGLGHGLVAKGTGAMDTDRKRVGGEEPEELL
jgi:hypothetical protein